jgi:dihydroorotase
VEFRKFTKLQINMESSMSRIVGRLYGEGDLVEIRLNVNKIAEIIPAQKPSEQEQQQIILPGLVDLHTHLREPGFERSETIESGSRSAAAGGFTCVFAMANTEPTSDTAASLETTKRIGDEVGLVQVQPIGAVTKGLEGEVLADLSAMASSKAKARVFSDDGKCVSDPLIMRRALEYVKTFDGVIAQHAEDPRLTQNAQMNEGALSNQLGLKGWPGVAEESIIARDILLADMVGANLHICHLSTKKSVEIVRFAKSQGMRVTAEATPHHLTLTEDLLETYNPRYKVNPPLRTREDVEALRRGVQDGTIDIVATDHAPHALEMKYCNYQDSAFGMTGLETALASIQMALIDTQMISWRDVGRIMSETPAKIGQVEATQGQKIAVGKYANLCIYNPHLPKEVIPEDQKTRSTNSPYKHMVLPGRVIQTYYLGKQTF